MKIISGGQTGADIAGIDAAINCGVPYGGFLPKGRKTEDGPLSGCYECFTEMNTASYPKRTEANAINSDGTIIFTRGKLKGGSKLTAEVARKHGKPFLHIDLSQNKELFEQTIFKWINQNSIAVINIAGTRASKDPLIYDEVYSIVKKILLSVKEIRAFAPGAQG